ncbi:hypothetical protein MKW94_003170 [Papaver nudicaule]|uniref:DNA-directed RNA polymerase III subunit RPC6 n=1 Tax=Papaver nudicaule TaxID=74823 RepID=A0AA41V8R6_PAPNU|nr:hypothetical protein [Papaver nudicaule]MCL7043512.1 hypothetical protein [Papaver nudicaule]MCL7044327.1 hypothetical protein [Papaver nudicaule]
MSRVADSSLTLKRKRADTPRLSEDDRKVYDVITSTESAGIWMRDLKRKLNRPDTVINKSIKFLKDKKLIKEVVNIQNKGKKHFMGFDFEPSVDLTGGAWYDDEGKLDKTLIEVSKSQCLQFITRSKVATIGEITEAINNLGLFKVKLTGVQIEEVVQSLILDKEIVEAQSTGKGDFAIIPAGEQCYRRSNKRGLPKTGALASIPCGVCPRLNECTPNGVISPSTCVYFKKWLDF